MKKSSNFDVQLIKEQLFEADYHDIVTFSQLSALLGKDVQGEHYHLLYRALKELEDDGYVFENVRNIGYRRMSDEERAMTDRMLVSIAKKADRGIKQKSLGIDYDGLTQEGKVSQQVHLTVLNITRKAVSKRHMRQIEKKINRIGDKIDGIEKQLEMFRKEVESSTT